MGPALLYGILPEKYWRNYCKLVRAVRILLQQDILPVELAEAHTLMTAFSDEFEQLYVQRLESRMHFVRPAIHTLSHMPGETARKGPGNIYSQWALERTIGNLGQEIRQHSNPYANLAMRGIRRCQVNALTAFIPDLDPEPVFGPRGSINVGGGFFLLRATDSCKRKVRQCEEDAIREYIDDNADDEGLAERWNGLVARWARARLPNGQTARSAFQESRRSDPTRAARHVKVCYVLLDGVLELAEVQFYMHLVIEEKDHYIAIASVFGPPHPHLLDISSQVYWTVQHMREADVRAFAVTCIQSCAMMAPDEQYAQFQEREEGSEQDRWFLMEKPGLKLLAMLGLSEDVTDE
ncbi:hypothetical protein C8J57DRAFT_1191344 [Mycena rebaudengoi]|nr:hypothetical protein C8J57DRAFT_1191344 [Mycena rebaudengoi]